MKGIARRKWAGILAVIAGAVVLVFFAGAGAGNISQAGRTPSEQRLLHHNPASGEVIPDQFMVQKKDGSVLLVTEKEAEKLKNDPQVKAIEPNRVVVALGDPADQARAFAVTGDDVRAMQYGDRLVNAPVAWEMLEGQELSTVRVAVVDTGVDPTHPDLQGKVIAGKTIITETAAGNRYTTDDGRDDNGHGTHVAGIIAATIENGIGINGVTGSVDVEILPVKILNDGGSGSTYDVVNGIRYAADHGASILNMSFGSMSSSEIEQDAIRYAQNKGCLLVAAAGNDSIDARYNYPASYEGVICVGSVDAADQRSYFSNYGPGLDVAAPGSDIVSTIPKKIALEEIAQGDAVYGNDEEGYYASWSGTSMATPHVAGVAALYKAANPGMSGVDIGNLLISTARDVGDVGKDDDTGAGIVDAGAMLGGEIIRVPLRVTAPSKGSELYETVTLSAMVNQSMNISSLEYYLDETDEEHLIKKVDTTSGELYFDATWDTNENADGAHTLIALVRDDKNNLVGEPVEIGITILNSITDGYTISVSDPAGEMAQKARYSIYGESADGAMTLLKSGYTTELGFMRVKGLKDGYTRYRAVIDGSRTDDHKTCYLYSHALDPSLKGSKITITAEHAKEVAYSAFSASGEDIRAASLNIAPVDANGVIQDDIGMMPMLTDTQLYMDPGTYKVQYYRSTDTTGKSYYINQLVDIETGDEPAVLSIDAAEAAKVEPVYSYGTSGTLMLEPTGTEDGFPIINMRLSGDQIYVKSDTAFTAQAQIAAKDSGGRQSTMTIRKKEPYQITDDVQIPFRPDIRVISFEADTEQIKVGGTLRTSNEFGDTSGDILADAGTMWPTFSVFRLEEGERVLIYEKTDRWNTTSCYWNSATNYIGSVPPAAGSYIAQLRYDAGAFGGESILEIPFEMETASGHEEMTSTISIGEYKCVNASMELYTWNSADGGSWIRAHEDSLGVSDDTGVIRAIDTDKINLSDTGINVALIRLQSVKYGYQYPETFPGFALYPFEKLSDLQVIDIDEDSLTSLKISVYDQYGMRRKSNVYIPAMSDGGKLSETAQIADVRIPVTDTGASTSIYIPIGSYPYIYTYFNDSTDLYFISSETFDTKETGTVNLKGNETQKLTVETAGELTDIRLIVQKEGIEKAPAVTLGDADGIYMTPGQYHMKASVKNSSGNFRYEYAAPEVFDLEEEAQWKIGSRPEAVLKLKQSTVALNQMLTGSALLTDEFGNSIDRVEEKKDGFYTDVYPKLRISAQGLSGTELTIPFGEFTVSSDLYSGDGPHEAVLVTNIGEGEEMTEPVVFIVGQDYEASIASVSEQGMTVLERTKNQAVLRADKSGFEAVSFALAPSPRTRTVTLYLVRDGERTRAYALKGIFAEDNDTLSVKLNLKAGDQIEISVK